MRVVVVDRRGPAKGSSTASTALVQYEIDMPLTKLARKIGQRDAERAWRRSRLAVDAIAARLRELDVADVAARDSLYLAGNVLDRNGLMREHEARRAAGLASHFLERERVAQRDLALRDPPRCWATAISPSIRARRRLRCSMRPRRRTPESSARSTSSTSMPNEAASPPPRRTDGASIAGILYSPPATNCPSGCRPRATRSSRHGQSRQCRRSAGCGPSNA